MVNSGKVSSAGTKIPVPAGKSRSNARKKPETSGKKIPGLEKKRSAKASQKIPERNGCDTKEDPGKDNGWNAGTAEGEIVLWCDTDPPGLN